MSTPERKIKNMLSLENKIQIIDWLRKIGQAGIDQAKLSWDDIANEAAKLVKRPVTRANILDIMTSLKLKSAVKRTAPETNDWFKEITARVEALEAACKTAGIWPI